MLNRLICEKTVDSEDNVVVQYTYTLGAAGERKSVTELDRTVEYSYDSLYHLTSETITEGEKVTVYTYAYDNVSNRILKTENGAETEYIYNALNQLVSDSGTTYEYDLNGNLIRVIGTANSALYEYNSENKLVKATVQNGSLVIEESYTYDYEGNRTSKTTHKSNGEFEYTKYLNDNSSLTNVLAEIDENGTAKCVYTIGADLISQERNGRTSFYLYDGHGSVVGLANENGKVTDTYAYDAFGNLLDSTGSTKNCYRYCGEQFDETTGLYYLRARYMDTSTGRFISQDSYAGSISDPVSLHKYLYANANPVMNSDPSGYMSIAMVAVVGAIISSVSSMLVANLLSALKNLDENGTFETTLSIENTILIGVMGAIFGAFAGIALLSGVLWLKYIFVGIAFIGGFSTALSGFIEYKAGNYRTAIAYSFLSILSFVSAAIMFTSAKSSVPPKSDFRLRLEAALRELDKSGLRPGQTQISESKIFQLVQDFVSYKARSSVYSDGSTKYLVEGHHTTVAAEILGKGTGMNMGVPTEQMPSATNVYWYKEWYEFWKIAIEIIE